MSCHMQCGHNYDNNAVDITSEMYACKTEVKYQNNSNFDNGKLSKFGLFWYFASVMHAYISDVISTALLS